MSWIYTDEQGRVLANNPNDMSGNSGWINTSSLIPEILTDENGVALYKVSKGKIAERAQTEIDADMPVLEETKEAKAKTDYAKATTDKQRLDFMAKYLKLTNGAVK